MQVNQAESYYQVLESESSYLGCNLAQKQMATTAWGLNEAVVRYYFWSIVILTMDIRYVLSVATLSREWELYLRRNSPSSNFDYVVFSKIIQG
jgi:hypothetical protein